MSSCPPAHQAPVLAARWPAAAEAAELLRIAGRPALVAAGVGDGAALVGDGVRVLAPARDVAADWAGSGAMALTGWADGPALHTTGRPATLARAAGLAFELLSAEAGQPVSVDGAAELGRRAALSSAITRRGQTSVGGGCRLFRAADGWLALNLARPDDVELVPALTERPVGEDPWAEVQAWARQLPGQLVVERAALLGLAVGLLPNGPAAPPAAPWTVQHKPSHGPPARRRPLVVNLGQLWAAPLAAHLLHQAGAEVVDVEATNRPDGSRLGMPSFYAALHQGHTLRQLDFGTSAGRAELAGLLHDADVVLESSRPRALRELGVAAETVLADGRPRVWVRITGHGQRSNRVAFGDDAAVDAGLVGWAGAGKGARPVFAGDAIADPLTGLLAAVAVLAQQARGQQSIVDLALRDVAAWACRHGGSG